MKNFYLVWEESTGYTKYKHENIISAEEEAKRLARLHPGKSFHVLLAVTRVIVDDIKVEHSDGFRQLFDTIPF